MRQAITPVGCGLRLALPVHKKALRRQLVYVVTPTCNTIIAVQKMSWVRPVQFNGKLKLKMLNSEIHSYHR